MKLASRLFLLAGVAVGAAHAYSHAPLPETSRRTVLATAGAAAAAMLLGPRQAAAESDEDVLTPLYFGVGVS
jgi:hypothetical protein